MRNLEPSKLPVRQKGCVKAASGVKYVSIALRCADGGVCVSWRITPSISFAGLETCQPSFLQASDFRNVITRIIHSNCECLRECGLLKLTQRTEIQTFVNLMVVECILSLT